MEIGEDWQYVWDELRIMAAPAPAPNFPSTLKNCQNIVQNHNEIGEEMALRANPPPLAGEVAAVMNAIATLQGSMRRQLRRVRRRLRRVRHDFRAMRVNSDARLANSKVVGAQALTPLRNARTGHRIHLKMLDKFRD